jgi:hypothetical protein
MQTIKWSLDLQASVRHAKSQINFESVNNSFYLTPSETKSFYKAFNKNSTKQEENEALELWI